MVVSIFRYGRPALLFILDIFITEVNSSLRFVLYNVHFILRTFSLSVRAMFKGTSQWYLSAFTMLCRHRHRPGPRVSIIPFVVLRCFFYSNYEIKISRLCPASRPVRVCPTVWWHNSRRHRHRKKRGRCFIIGHNASTSSLLSSSKKKKVLFC